MTEKLDDTWSARDLPVLTEVVRYLDEKPNNRATRERVAAATGLSVDDVTRAGVALKSAGLVTVDEAWGVPVTSFTSISAEARRICGQWPTPESATDRVLATLDERIEASGNDSERGRLVKIREAIGGAGRDLFVDVMGTVISKTITG